MTCLTAKIVDPDGPTGNLSLGDGQFNKPSGIAVDSDYVFVVDHNNQTQKFDYDGNFVNVGGLLELLMVNSKPLRELR